MNGNEILRIVDAIHRDKAIDAEIVFEGIEQAILSAARKHFSEEEKLEVRIDRETGEPALICDGAMLDPELLGDLLGRISAQTAKQVMIQKIREAERDTLYEEFLELRSQQVSGQVTRVDRGTVIVSLGKVEAILPRSEQIRKENYRTGDRVRAIVLDVRKTGSRVRVILSGHILILFVACLKLKFQKSMTGLSKFAQSLAKLVIDRRSQFRAAIRRSTVLVPALVFAVREFVES
jgi:N utilization substance protein A